MFLSSWPSHAHRARAFTFSAANLPACAAPAVHGFRNEAGWEFTADIPGCSAADVTVDATADTLTLSAQRKGPAEEGASETPPRWSLNESYRFARPIDVDRVEAIVKDGVLTIKVPRAAPTMPPRTITVTTA